MFALIRRCLGIRVVISADEAIEIAREYCREHDFPWLEPVEISLRLRSYEIWTNAQSIGSNSWIVVNCSTGEIQEAGFSPR
jgi:hypothetical protein